MLADYAHSVAPFWDQARRPIVPLHVAGKNGTTVYAVTSQRIVADLINMRFGVELLGEPDAPLRTDLYLLRDDAAAASGFLAPQGESARFFADEQDARLVLSGTAEGLVVALPPERSLEEFHFTQARHGHTLKLLPDPSLLEPPAPSAWVRESALAGPIERPTTRDLTAEEITELTKITGQELLDRAERYGGRQPLNPNRDARLASRHTFHAGNAQAVTALAAELQAVGRGKLTVRLIPFTHAGRRLQNIEAELPGTSRELVLVAAHLDSTAAFSDPYNAEQDSAPGVDDDASGMAAVVTIAERFAVLASKSPPQRTLRFLLFNAEEHGLVGSRAYARQQKLQNAQIVAVLQMDMIGYNRHPPRSWEVHAGYAPSAEVESGSVALAGALVQHCPRVSPRLDRPQVYPSATAFPEPGDPAEGRSDHAPFQACGYVACVASEDFFLGPEPKSPNPQPNPNYH